MSKVHGVDLRVIERTQQWLAHQQQPDGSWRPDGPSNQLRATAYIAWALETTGYHGPEIDRARAFVETHRKDSMDAYTLAVATNFLPHSHDLIQQLLDTSHDNNSQAWWTAEQTSFFGHGTAGAIETTALAVQALLRSGESPAIARKALAYLTAQKDAYGAWGTTQATVMALRALVLSARARSGDAEGTVELTLNDKSTDSVALTAENRDLFHQLVVTAAALKNSNQIDLQLRGKGALEYQLVGRYFVPWSSKTGADPLSIDITYDHTRVNPGDILTATAAVRNHLSHTADMVMLELGIPPGFDLLTEDLDDYHEKTAGRKSGRLEKFTLTPTHAVLYFDSIAANDSLHLRYRLRAKYPVRAGTFKSRVYEYYDPEVSAVARPTELEIRSR